ncbi:hypothetical protein ACFPZ0_06195 [Streptomonospora nanhaiensis]|uniref:Uncharacterized protein n=1 Tax=Streptomonospora nanhaiensis TaxID=1323731 RepID=A0A853BJT7_9ACTN|nr:hypothetical protein [Streptomonospora nanhaiensis]MBV2365633.1 hypothetical protein [Streptomonospora nanhaiensis]MBX9389043.1 hypothetical protein [Streptomonospora nanhaiensis]NYI95533.1 hypothetical protein [Streptomonospora nanhaiensis]
MGVFDGKRVLLAPEEVAAAVEHILELGRTGEVWTVAAGHPPAPFPFPEVPGLPAPGRGAAD